MKNLWEGNVTRNKSRMNIAAAGGICVSQTHLVFNVFCGLYNLTWCVGFMIVYVYV